MRLWLLILVLLPLFASSAIYRTVDENGNVTYTDTPAADKAESTDKIELPKANTMPAAPAVNFTPAQTNNEPKHYTLSITSPADEALFDVSMRDVNIQVDTQPSLHKNHSLQLFWNGAKHGAPSKSTNMAIKEIHRGEHTLYVQALNRQGKPISTSNSVTIIVRRPSKNHPNRR